MIDDLQLMRLHVDALFTHDARGRLLRVNELGGRAIAPRMFFGRTAAGHVLRVRADVPDPIAQELQAIVRDEPVVEDLAQRPHCGAPLRAVLARHEPVRVVWTGPAYSIDLNALPDSRRDALANAPPDEFETVRIRSDASP